MTEMLSLAADPCLSLCRTQLKQSCRVSMIGGMMASSAEEYMVKKFSTNAQKVRASSSSSCCLCSVSLLLLRGVSGPWYYGECHSALRTRAPRHSVMNPVLDCTIFLVGNINETIKSRLQNTIPQMSFIHRLRNAIAFFQHTLFDFF